MRKRVKRKPEDIYGIVGLGRFGFNLAKNLAEMGKEILVIDNDPKKIKEITEYTDNAFLVEELTKETLIETGIQNCDTVIVGIGETIDIGILATLNIIQLGVKKVIVIGGSMGGMQALEWSVRYPDITKSVVVIASTSKLSAQAIGFNAVGRNAILNDENYQIIITDTPGIHKPKTKLGETMVSTAFTMFAEVDVILFLIEADSTKIGRGDRLILEKIKESKMERRESVRTCPEVQADG